MNNLEKIQHSIERFCDLHSAPYPISDSEKRYVLNRMFGVGLVTHKEIEEFLHKDDEVSEKQVTNFERVAEFHITYKCVINKIPSWPDQDTLDVRMKLIEEELQELKDGIVHKDIVEVADALTDLLYVVYGTGHSFGIDLDACFAEVHASNMTKLDENGQPIFREDGKVLKGPNFREPDLENVLNESKKA